MNESKISSQNKRFFNFLADSILIYITALFVSYFFPISGFYFFIPFFYYFIFEITLNKTPAKFLTKTVVIKSKGGKLKYQDILLRTISRYIPFEAFTFLDNKFPVGWHDKISGTIVISETK